MFSTPFGLFLVDFEAHFLLIIYFFVKTNTVKRGNTNQLVLKQNGTSFSLTIINY